MKPVAPVKKIFINALSRVRDKNPHVFGRAALLRRPRIQGRAAALPYQENEDFCHALAFTKPWMTSIT
jgi:hypothetical protein